MSSLELRNQTYYRGYAWTEVVETDPDPIATTVMTAVAATLAAPLRKAFYEHMDSHRGEPWCDECQRLSELLPYGDRPVVIG